MGILVRLLVTAVLQLLPFQLNLESCTSASVNSVPRTIGCDLHLHSATLSLRVHFFRATAMLSYLSCLGQPISSQLIFVFVVAFFLSLKESIC